MILYNVVEFENSGLVRDKCVTRARDKAISILLRLVLAKKNNRDKGLFEGKTLIKNTALLLDILWVIVDCIKVNYRSAVWLVTTQPASAKLTITALILFAGRDHRNPTHHFLTVSRPAELLESSLTLGSKP